MTVTSKLQAIARHRKSRSRQCGAANLAILHLEALVSQQVYLMFG